MPDWLTNTVKTAGKIGLAALAATLVSSWLIPSKNAAGHDRYYGMVVDPTVDIGRGIPRLSNLGVHTVRLRIDIKNWNDPAANVGAPAQDAALKQAQTLKPKGFEVVLQVNSVGGVMPSYARASAVFRWVLRRPGAGSVDVIEVLGPVTDHDSNADAFSTSLPINSQARRYVTGPLRAAWDVFHSAGKNILGGAFTLWQQAKDFSSAGTYRLAVTRAYVRAGYLDYVDYAGMRPYVNSPTSQVEWVSQAKPLFGRKPIWISEWGLNRNDYPTLAAYTAAMTKAVSALRPKVALVCYATFTPSATSDGVVKGGLTGYRPVQPAYNAYRGWPKH